MSRRGTPAEVRADPAVRRRLPGRGKSTLRHAAEQSRLFIDVPGDQICRWSARDGVATFRKPSNKANGLAWDRDGRLLVCEHATGRVTRTEPDGTVTTLASHYGGKKLNSSNDIVVNADGGTYFTNPIDGRVEFYGVPRSVELGFQGVYRLEPDGKSLRLLADDFGQPNGLCFSPGAGSGPSVAGLIAGRRPGRCRPRSPALGVCFGAGVVAAGQGSRAKLALPPHRPDTAPPPPAIGLRTVPQESCPVGRDAGLCGCRGDGLAQHSGGVFNRNR